MNDARLRTGKIVLLSLIAITSVLPLLAVEPEDPLRVNVFKYLAKTGAFLGSMFMVWQFLLGFRGAMSRVFPDLSWVALVHKRLGQFGVPIIVLHPVFIGLYYVEVERTNIYALVLAERFSQLVLLGMVILGLVAFIVITSAFLREQLGFYRWLYLHLSSYLVPPLLFVHSFLLGQTIQQTWLRYYWIVVSVIVGVLYVYRVLHKLGLWSSEYRVTRVREVADESTEITMAPQDKRLEPAQGQFVYLRGSVREDAHPYTVSGFDGDSGQLSVTVSEVGSQSARLQEIDKGARLLLDGPYGVFTRPAMATGLPTVMIAGGVGITPFRRLWQRLEDQGRDGAHLFYGNERYEDIAYRDELDALEHVQVVHVLNDEDDFDGEQGLVTVDVLRRNLPGELTDYQFLMCGPPPMVEGLEEQLLEAGIPEEQIRHELFSA